MIDPVFSRRDVVNVAPAGSGRRYVVAPLTFRERAAYQADLSRFGGVYPTTTQMMQALRSAVEALAPSNAAELLEMLTRAELDPNDAQARQAVQIIEASCSMVPAYAELLAARTRYLAAVPWVAARHALREWDGPGLPAFRRERGVVPEELLDAVPPDELEEVGWQAAALLRPGASAEGNSASPSPSPTTPAPATAASNPTTAADGFLPAESGTATPA
jgi:hypothetical protein